MPRPRSTLFPYTTLFRSSVTLRGFIVAIVLCTGNAILRELTNIWKASCFLREKRSIAAAVLKVGTALKSAGKIKEFRQRIRDLRGFNGFNTNSKFAIINYQLPITNS